MFALSLAGRLTDYVSALRVRPSAPVPAAADVPAPTHAHALHPAAVARDPPVLRCAPRPRLCRGLCCPAPPVAAQGLT